MGNSDHGTEYMRVGGDYEEFRPWHYIYVYSIESRLIRTVTYLVFDEADQTVLGDGDVHICSTQDLEVNFVEAS